MQFFLIGFCVLLSTKLPALDYVLFPDSDLAKHVIHGMQKAGAKIKFLDHQKLDAFVRSTPEPGRLIGGLSRSHNQALLKLANQFPNWECLLLSNREHDTETHCKRVLPGYADLSQNLIELAKRRGMKRLAVFYNKGLYESFLADGLKLAAFKTDIEINHFYSYEKLEERSLRDAIRTMLQLDPVLRAEEFQKLLEQAKKEGKDLSRVMLKPIRDFDGLIVADDFSHLRQIVQILRYYGLRRLPLLGTPQWRARGLIHPPDPMLEGAQFVDYVGLYSLLPPGLRQESDDFLKEDVALSLDPMYLGYKIGTKDYNWKFHAFEVEGLGIRQLF
jgi:hypothetical protein